MGSTVLVTGVAGYLGGRLAREFCECTDIDQVIGVDVAAPSMDIGDAEFVRMDIRSAVIARIMTQARVDTVVHTSVESAPRGGSRTAQMETNVLGTMQLLAACQATPTVRRIVVKSTGAVYGSSPRDPAMFTEDMALRAPPKTGYIKDVLEIEGYVAGVTRRRPEVAVVVLRMAHLIGANVESPLTDFFRRAVIPMPFGFDARLQLLHEDDAVAALVRATVAPVSGIINVAGAGILTLTQAIAVARRIPLPVAPHRGGMLGRRVNRISGAQVDGEEFEFLLWGRALDTTRMRTLLGMEPAYTTRGALEDFVAQVGNPIPNVGAAAGPVMDLAGGTARLLLRRRGRERKGG